MVNVKQKVSSQHDGYYGIDSTTYGDIISICNDIGPSDFLSTRYLVPKSNTKDLKRARDVLQSDLDQVQQTIISSLNNKSSLVNEINEYILSAAGKKIRPTFVVLFSKIFACDQSKYIDLAAAVELIHVGTLMHDDVVDSNYVRRFKPTANAIWNNSLSILSGDALFCAAFKLMIKSRSFEALEILSDALSVIVSGEVNQIAVQKKNIMISYDEYIKIILEKTSALFAASCKIPGVISNQDNNTMSSLHKIGTLIGIIFQMADDLIDYFCSSDIIGKDRFNDFLEKKITFPILILNQIANMNDRNKLLELSINNMNPTLDEAQKVLDYFSKYNILDHGLHKISQIRKILQIELSLLPDVEFVEHIKTIIDYVISNITTNTSK